MPRNFDVEQEYTNGIFCAISRRDVWNTPRQGAEGARSFIFRIMLLRKPGGRTCAAVAG
jgi:hypothetical protein